jgi:hypothetical protein
LVARVDAFPYDPLQIATNTDFTFTLVVIDPCSAIKLKTTSIFSNMLTEALTGELTTQTFEDLGDNICRESDPTLCCGPRIYRLTELVPTLSLNSQVKKFSSTSLSLAEVGKYEVTIGITL